MLCRAGLLSKGWALAATLRVSSCSASMATDASNKSAGQAVKEAVGEGVKKVGEAFQDDGAIGKQFNADGAAGGTARKLGGPFRKDGAIGKQFTSEGSVGGTVEQAAEAGENYGDALKSEARGDAASQGLKDAASSAMDAASNAADSMTDGSKPSN